MAISAGESSQQSSEPGSVPVGMKKWSLEVETDETVLMRHISFKRLGRFILASYLVAAVIMAVSGLASAMQQDQAVEALDWADLPFSSSVPLSDTVEKAVTAAFLTPEEQRQLRIFHGIWKPGDLRECPTAARAAAAMLTYHLDDPVWDDPDVPSDLLYQRLAAIGAYDRIVADRPPDEVINVTSINSADSLRAVRLTAEALHWLGRKEEASSLLDSLRPALSGSRSHISAAFATEAARVLVLQARIEGFPGTVYQQAVQQFGHVEQRLDRLYWPARLSLGQLLYSKDNRAQAADAFREVLQMNPRCSEAWYGLGSLGLDTYHFEAAESAIEELRAINPEHLLADLLAARLALIQSLPEIANLHLAEIGRQWPLQRQMLAYVAAGLAVAHDIDGMDNALDDFDALSPGHPYTYYIVGEQLSRQRQYEESARALNEAVRRDPTWPAALIELGLMEFQAGRDQEARAALERAQRLDPFNQRATFTLHLIEKLASYHRIESARFAVRFEPGSTDRLLAGEMLEPLERMATDVHRLFEHEPDGRTLIELLPTHEQFAVRITGMPDIFTIAVSTGPIIAMESPRLSAQTSGTYDWLRVIRHEYIHRVTLSRSDNRMPHWLTEGVAVWGEGAPRTYTTCLALVHKMHSPEGLFSLSELNWAFVRPRVPGDRSLAYAQSHWMVEYLIKQFGRESLLTLLDRYRDGDSEHVAMQAALSVSTDVFMAGFIDWARRQVGTWGLDPDVHLETVLESAADHPDIRALRNEPVMGGLVAEALRDHAQRVLRWVMVPTDYAPARQKPPAVPAVTPPLDLVPESVWDDLLVAYPVHPDVLEQAIRVKLRDRGDTEDVISLLKRYLRTRPVDPMPHRELARIYLASNRADQAIEHLEALDVLDERDSTFAVELARLYRQSGHWDRAFDKALRAITMAPFNPSYRELAAAIAIQNGDFESARHQIEALLILEPNQPQHRKRLEALDRLQQQRRDASTG